VESDALNERLAAIVGPGHVLTDPALREPFEHDLTGRYGAPASVVVRPGSTDEVAAVMRVCAETRTPVVPQGGNTGLVGGGVPRGGEVVLSLGRLDGLGPVDTVANQVTAGAGATLESVQAHARAAGLAFGVDHGARSGASIGGMVSTDAGGAQVLRYGTMRAQVMGMEAVFANGGVLRRLAGPDGLRYQFCNQRMRCYVLLRQARERRLV
jgi:FAD/FMN-containing dehydrogenase